MAREFGMDDDDDWNEDDYDIEVVYVRIKPIFQTA